MQQEIDNIYKWRMYEKILLGFASAYGWLPVVWAFFLPDIMSPLGWIIRVFSITEGSPLMETVFLSYIIACGIIYGIIFGGLAYIFPKTYILPVWILNLLSFVIGVKQIVTSILDPYEPDSFYYPESGYTRYHTFSFQNIYLTVLALFFLIILSRPVLFYFRVVIRGLIRGRSGRGPQVKE